MVQRQRCSGYICTGLYLEIARDGAAEFADFFLGLLHSAVQLTTRLQCKGSLGHDDDDTAVSASSVALGVCSMRPLDEHSRCVVHPYVQKM